MKKNFGGQRELHPRCDNMVIFVNCQAIFLEQIDLVETKKKSNLFLILAQTI